MQGSNHRRSRRLPPARHTAFTGFPADYEIASQFNGRPLTKTAQIELAGNSVCLQVAEAIVAANTRERDEVAA